MAIVRGTSIGEKPMALFATIAIVGYPVAMRNSTLAILFCGSIIAPCPAAEGTDAAQRRPDHRRRHGLGRLRGLWEPERQDAPHRPAGPRGHAVRPGLRHGQFVQPEPLQHHHGTISAQHRRRGAALAAAGRAGHVRREAEGVRLLDRRRRQVAPGHGRQGSVRRRAGGRPVGLPTGGPGRPRRPG